MRVPLSILALEQSPSNAEQHARAGSGQSGGSCEIVRAGHFLLGAWARPD